MKEINEFRAVTSEMSRVVSVRISIVVMYVVIDYCTVLLYEYSMTSIALRCPEGVAATSLH